MTSSFDPDSASVNPESSPTDQSAIAPDSALDAPSSAAAWSEEDWNHENWADPTTTDAPKAELENPHLANPKAPIALVETAFLASTTSLLWIISYYLSLSPWTRIFFPTPIALVYLRWGKRSAWMAAIVTTLLLSVLMGPYLSILFLLPYGILGVQLGALWRRGAGWGISIGTGMVISTLSFFFRVGLLSAFLGEDVWAYLNNRIADLSQWVLSLLVNWGILGIDMLARPNLLIVQILTVGALLLSDAVYLFTVHLGAWVLLTRLGNPIPEPPEWVQILLEEEV
jgi:uncharacterized protein YybS (DUF2232 family)